MAPCTPMQCGNPPAEAQFFSTTQKRPEIFDTFRGFEPLQLTGQALQSYATGDIVSAMIMQMGGETRFVYLPYRDTCRNVEGLYGNTSYGVWVVDADRADLVGMLRILRCLLPHLGSDKSVEVPALDVFWCCGSQYVCHLFVKLLHQVDRQLKSSPIDGRFFDLKSSAPTVDT